MIIILEPQKDAYVTNINTRENKGIEANSGNAATLDLFKLYNENKFANSWAIFQFSNSIEDGQVLVLKDANGVTKTFEFDNNDSVLNNNIAIVGSNNGNEASLIKAAIEAESDFAINAYVDSNNTLVLKQKKSGSSGDTSFTLPTNMTHSYNLSSFARIDYSACLIKFDISNFKSEWITLSDAGALQGSFENLQAEIVLKDVNTGITKPKEFRVEALKMLKDFDEGIGKDTIYFSDKGPCNFTNLDSSTNNIWEIPGIITQADADSISSDFYVEKGNEDIVLNVTDYIKQQLVNTTDKGFLIKLTNEFLFNNKSYFAKRLGSRHLTNKKLVPELRIKINDSSYHIPISSFNKIRFLNNDESFYLFNKVNGQLSNFANPAGLNTLKFKITNKDNDTDLITPVDASSNITNLRGQQLSGIFKATVNVSKFEDNISSLIKNNKLEANYVWYWTDDGTNIKTVKTQRVDFVISETQESFDFENLISVIKIDENFISSDNSVTSLKVYFTDTRKEFDAVKVPYELPSENLGNVHYQIYDVETNKVIVDYDNSATLMFFDGEKYVFDVFIPKIFKDRRINFKFKYKDIVTDNEKYIFNEKYSVRII